MTHTTAQVENGRHWPKGRALTAIAAAWIVLDLFALTAVFCGHAIGDMFAEALPGVPRERIFVGSVGLASLVAGLAAWGTCALTLGRSDSEEDYVATDITPMSIRFPGILVPPVLCYVAGYLNSSVAYAIVAFFAMAMIALCQPVLINRHLGPIIRRRAPEIWSEALERHREEEGFEPMDLILVAIVSIGLVLSITLIVGVALLAG